MNLRRIRVLLVVCLMLSGMSLVRAQEDAPLKVVATYSILGDIVQNVAGDNIELTVLVGPDSDSHIYEPTPQDLMALAEADILFENGLEFELWLDDLYEASGSSAIRVEVSAGVDALPFDDDHHHHDHHHDHDHNGLAEGDWIRLAVNDHESGTVHVIDLSSGEVVATFELSARATLYTSENGRYVYAVQTAANAVNVIDSGVRQVWHDDHYDTDIGSPAVLDFVATGSRPIHFVTWDEWVSIFNDGDGTVAIFSEDDVHHADAEVILISTERPHHGVGAAVGEYVLTGIANMDNLDSSLPVGVAVYTLDNELVPASPTAPACMGKPTPGIMGWPSPARTAS